MFCIGANSQSLNDVKSFPKQVSFEREINARFNFTGLIDPYDQNISVGGEYRVNEHWSLGSDIAYIFKSYYVPESKYSRGYILRPFVRYYPYNRDKYSFFEAGFHYKHVSYQIKDWLGRDVINGVPSYEEFSTFHFLKNAFEFNMKIGTATDLTRDKKFRMEFYIGLGYRFKGQHSDFGAYMPQRTFFSDRFQPHFSTLTLPMGVRIVYTFK
jgi:hypothetical protein